MNTLYGTETYTDDFEIDFADKGGCKGIVMLEVYVPALSVPLLVKDGSEQRISEHTRPFVVQSNYPITKGTIRFVFSEYEALQNPNRNSFKKAVVRYLYCE